MRAGGRAGRRPRRRPRWTSSSAGCARRLESGEPGPRPAAGPPRCGRPGSGTPSTPSCPPPRSWPAPRPTSTGSARELREAAAELVGGPATDETVRRGARPARRASTRTTPRSSSWPRSRWTRRPTSSASTTWSPCRRPVRDRGDAGVRPRRRGGLLRPARPAGDRRRAHLLLHRADPGGLAGGAGRVVLPRVQRPHAAQPHRARGDARPLPAARPRPPLPRPRPGCGRSAGPARSSRAGRSTPRS